MSNPFFEPFPETGIPPFSEIRFEHFGEAFDRAFNEWANDIDAIVDSGETPDFINTIEAMENPLALIYNGGFSEVQKYVNLTAHVDSWSYVVFGEQQFQRFPEHIQELILSCAEEMQEYESKLHLQEEKEIRQQLSARGMEFISVDREAFSLAAKQALFESLSPEMQEIYNQIQDLGE